MIWIKVADRGEIPTAHGNDRSSTEGGKHEQQGHDAARGLLQSDRPSRRLLAASARAEGRARQYPPLRRDRADRRARQVRHDLPGRFGLGAAGRHRGAVPLGAVHRQFRADHAAVGAGDGDRAHRPGGDRVDELQRALSRRAQVRLARPYQRRPRRPGTCVTSGSRVEALNFNRTAPYPHAERYKRAHEFVEVVTGLWDSWDDDAFVRDQESGIFFDRDKMHRARPQGPELSRCAGR